jgi:hypothetical protein
MLLIYSYFTFLDGVKAILVHCAHRLLSESTRILCTLKNRPRGKQTPGDFTTLRSIPAIPKRTDVEKFCRRQQTEWRSVGGGLAKITPYDPRLAGAGYVAKRAAERQPQLQAALAFSLLQHYFKLDSGTKNTGSVEPSGSGCTEC